MAEENKNLPSTSHGNAVKKQAAETVDLVLSKVKGFLNNGDLHLPPNYSAANALKSAWLIIQDTKDKDKRPALEVCTKRSIANTLLDMVVQGLNPAKKQCYFIVYGDKLVLQRSYFGTKAVCLRVDTTIADIYAEAVYKGDNLEYSIIRGKKMIEDHRQKLENIDESNIIAAYAVSLDHDGNTKRCEIMTLDQLKQAWKQSKMYPIDKNGNIKDDSTHGKFTSEMAKKTVTSRLAKHIINVSSDSDLLIQTIRRTDDMQAQLSADQEAEEYGNQDLIDIEPVQKQIEDTGERQEDPPPPDEDPDAWMNDPDAQPKTNKPPF